MSNPTDTETDPLATVPAEEQTRIVEIATKERHATGMRTTAPWAGEYVYEKAIAREVAAWHAAHPAAPSPTPETLTREGAPPVKRDPGAVREGYCGIVSESRRAMICTRRPHTDGEHVAEGVRGEVLERWTTPADRVTEEALDADTIAHRIARGWLHDDGAGESDLAQAIEEAIESERERAAAEVRALRADDRRCPLCWLGYTRNGGHETERHAEATDEQIRAAFDREWQLTREGAAVEALLTVAQGLEIDTSTIRDATEASIGSAITAEVRALRAERDDAAAALAQERNDGDGLRAEIERRRVELALMRREAWKAVARPAPAADAGFGVCVDCCAPATSRVGFNHAPLTPVCDACADVVIARQKTAPAADASEEARAQKAHAAWVADRGRHLCAWDDLPAAERTIWLAVVRAVDASCPGLTEEEARKLAEHIGIKLGLAKDGDEEPVVTATRAILGWYASRGEAPLTSGDAIECLGPEPGILAPAASNAAPPPVPAGHVSVPRAILERLAKAAASDASAREARWAAERILQQAALRHEPARTDPDAARGETRRTASTNLHTAGAALVLQDIARSCAAITSDDAPARLELAPTALDLLRALGAHLTTATIYEPGKHPQETTTARLTVDALEILARESHDAEGPIVEPEPPPAILPHVLAALRRARDAATYNDSGHFLLEQVRAAVENAAGMLAIGRVHAAIDILSDIEPEEEHAS